MQRRSFITLLGGAAAAWPVAARAQQLSMPVVGYLYAGMPDSNQEAAFRQGLGEQGFVEGRNVAIEYRFARGDYRRLPELAADLAARRVAVIAAPASLPGALAAKDSTTTIPVVFSTGSDPVAVGLVPSLNRPGGNVTGIASMNVEVGAKRLGLLHELLPQAVRISVLVTGYPVDISDLRAAASRIGWQLDALAAPTSRDIDTAFASLAEKPADALLITPSPFFIGRRTQIVTLAARYMVPVMYPAREFADAGGLMSYGPSLADLFRQTGLYTGRVLKGEKPADLPVMRAIKFEFVINLQSAKLFNLTVPPTLLAIADEVIE